MILYVIHVHEFDLHIYSDIRSLFFSLSDKNVLIKTKVQHFLHYFMNGVMCAIKEFEVLYTETYVTHTHARAHTHTNHICTNNNFQKMIRTCFSLTSSKTGYLAPNCFFSRGSTEKNAGVNTMLYFVQNRRHQKNNS